VRVLGPGSAGSPGQGGSSRELSPRPLAATANPGSVVLGESVRPRGSYAPCHASPGGVGARQPERRALVGSSTDPRIDEIVEQVAGFGNDIQRSGDNDQFGMGERGDKAGHAFAYAAGCFDDSGRQHCSGVLHVIACRHGASTVRGAAQDRSCGRTRRAVTSSAAGLSIEVLTTKVCGRQQRIR